jgi:hypothetical protein
MPQPVVYSPASATIKLPARPKTAKTANSRGLAVLAVLAALAVLNPPKADANPIAIPPFTPASLSDKNSHNANGSLE